jgi:hypothetical protein
MPFLDDAMHLIVPIAVTLSAPAVSRQVVRWAGLLLLMKLALREAPASAANAAAFLDAVARVVKESGK